MQSVKQNETARIASIDILRGISLFGIFLVNMLSFHSPYFYYNPYEWWEAPQDKLAFSWIDVLVQASFYPIFAAMFGFGAAMQHEKALERTGTFAWTGVRRFSFLLVLGIAHAIFIWPGDILFIYAVCGFLLLFFLRFSAGTLLRMGLILLLVPAVLFSVLLFVSAESDPYNALFWTDITSVSDSIAAYGSGSYAEVTEQRIHDWTNNNIFDGAFGFQTITIFPFLLIGAGVYKQRLIQKWAAHPKKTFRMFALFFGAGLLLKGVPHLLGPSHIAYMYVQDSLGGPVLAASYAVLVVYLCTLTRPSKLLLPFAQAGKMSLTNYLMQSVIGSLLFYAYGLGFYGQVTVTTGILLCVTVFALQVMVSGLWLSRFQRGPMEAIWRFVTYGKKGMRK
ncbi:DUF418 domain-containing protein [Domibacillus sp. DTU_2020_1001157_1_SI_ALB_TIR_016]|uniref:DUF418 domain-containing protein n=1 Tax=Domibacillus sp. DTU_2020_1001157_1_SI_ALB_TIR_016 TaxID=3077789 RepID=UPI0028E52D6C|nr:DUF418 domain-containing protein [Domibacillus sp. DTU_2020_1001157_1_SI_ALB_TIR_016]WNS80071.1 DUF418 domain-containing protein [Domibacillus sp. DTU_2020_1001157_1_SI_ALB_TIR_016]